jgi:hypothetical protein
MSRVTIGAALLVAQTCAHSVEAAQCIAVSSRRLTGVPVTISLTPDGVATLKNWKLAFVHIRRVPNDGAAAIDYVRFIDPSGEPSMTFRFGHPGAYELIVRASQDYAWPADPETGQAVGCDVMPISIETNQEPEFAGVRGHIWGAYRPATQFELGGSVYALRVGVAVAAIANAAKSSEPNRLTGAFDVRWRRARGYIGGGVRYFPDLEADRNQWRPAIDVGEELPTFRGRPLWFILEVRFDDRKCRPWESLNFSFAARIDFTGTNQP